MSRAALPLVDRFNALIERSDGCWVWRGAVTEDGYGRFYVAGKTVSAHRLSYDLNVGEIHHGQWVLHRCDNPPCVRPDHLFLGDNLANVRDKMAKGRHHGLAGPMAPGSKFGEEIAAAILASDLSSRAAAQFFGLSKTTILNVRRNSHWTTR